MRPYTILKFATTIDGYLDDSSGERLLISSPEDFRRVDEVRASCDGIFVGAETIRKDNPKLLVRSPSLIAWRRERGMTDQPLKATVTRTGILPPEAAFFISGDSKKIVYSTVELTSFPMAELVELPEESLLELILEELYSRGVRRLLVEGGATIITQFLEENLFDELQISIGDILLGGGSGVRAFIGDFLPESRIRRLKLEKIEQLGSTVLITYKGKLLSEIA